MACGKRGIDFTVGKDQFQVQLYEQAEFKHPVFSLFNSVQKPETGSLTLYHVRNLKSSIILSGNQQVLNFPGAYGHNLNHGIAGRIEDIDLGYGIFRNPAVPGANGCGLLVESVR